MVGQIVLILICSVQDAELASRKEWLDRELAKVLEERKTVAAFEKVSRHLGGGRGGGDGACVGWGGGR